MHGCEQGAYAGQQRGVGLARGARARALHVPLLPVTRNLINAGRIKVMKSGAILLNFSRDGIVENSAVLAAIQGV